ncbi:MAG: ATP-binding protein, partial [Chitinophagaceae bacterium]|nr:ATP-binding protein [Chitinophagaceae bacterium]
MTEAELTQYLKTHYPCENKKCEWKAFTNLKHCISGHKGEDAISYVSAISNMEGGVLIMGVEDKTLSILGILNFHDYTLENILFRIANNCTNVNSEGLGIENFTTYTGKRVWVIHIPKHLPRKPVYAHKTAWQRNGDSLIPMTREREEAILHEPLYKSEDWSAVICEAANIQDLDPLAISRARENYKAKFPDKIEEVNNWNDVTFLNKAKITIKGKITRTAIILLGRPESEHFLSPSECKIRWILKDVSGTEKDYSIYS